MLPLIVHLLMQELDRQAPLMDEIDTKVSFYSLRS